MSHTQTPRLRSHRPWAEHSTPRESFGHSRSVHPAPAHGDVQTQVPVLGSHSPRSEQPCGQPHGGACSQPQSAPEKQPDRQTHSPVCASHSPCGALQSVAHVFAAQSQPPKPVKHVHVPVLSSHDPFPAHTSPSRVGQPLRGAHAPSQMSCE